MSHPDFYLHYLEVASLVHALSTILLGFLWILDVGYEFDHQTTYLEYLCIANSLGSFIEDTAMNAYFNTGDVDAYIHHAFSIVLLFAILAHSYGGMTLAAGLFFGELTFPFYLYWNYLRRKGYEYNTHFQISFWIFGLFFIMWRGAMYSINNYYTIISTTIPFVLKWLFLPIVFLSHLYMLMISKALWKNIPYWYSDPKVIEEAEWWKKGRGFFKKYVKDSPWSYIANIFIVIYSCIIPIAYAYYLQSNS